MRRRQGEHDLAEVTAILTQHLVTHGSISTDEAKRLVDASDQVIWRAYRRMERVLCIYKEGRRRVLLGED